MSIGAHIYKVTLYIVSLWINWINQNWNEQTFTSFRGCVNLHIYTTLSTWIANDVAFASIAIRNVAFNIYIYISQSLSLSLTLSLTVCELQWFILSTFPSVTKEVDFQSIKRILINFSQFSVKKLSNVYTSLQTADSIQYRLVKSISLFFLILSSIRTTIYSVFLCIEYQRFQ